MTNHSHSTTRRRGQRCGGVRLVVWTLVILLVLTLSQAEDVLDNSNGNLDWTVDGFLSSDDLQDCYDHLKAADTNNNNQVDNQEYVEFSQLMNPEIALLQDVQDYTNLPLAFKAAFLRTSCLCSLPDFGGNETAVTCCFGDAAHVQVTTNRLYLYAACSYNLAAGETVKTPTASPTKSPVAVVETDEPTASPTTTSPVVAGEPTATPTTTKTPTEPPTAAPVATETPTLEPTTFEPTVTPMPTISVAPTAIPIIRSATVFYDIQVTNGLDQLDNTTLARAYVNDLNESMNSLVPSVLTSMNYSTPTSSSSSTNSTERRRLTHMPSQVLFVYPSEITGLEDIVCSETTPITDLCQTVQASVSLQLINHDDDPDAVVSSFEETLSSAIQQGQLGAILNQVNPETPVTILDDTQVDSNDESGLSAGGIAGLVIGAAAIFILPIAFLALRKKSSKRDGSQAIETERVPDDKKAGETDSVISPSIASKDVYVDDKDGLLSDNTRLEKMEAGEDVMAEPGLDGDDDHETTASSEAGNSGWSSSAGLSSYNTGSLDDSMDAAYAPGGALATMGVTSALARMATAHKDDEDITSDSDADIAPEIARTQLDSLIAAGDWAAVGATAALLAAGSDTASQDSKSQVTSKSGRTRDTKDSDVDSARAAELDKLIDAGDWEGVVLAAAKFESAESDADTDGEHLSFDGDTDAGAESSHTGTVPSAASFSDSVSQSAKREEIRKEVAALVLRVVPEEINNVDEMMNQFKGREDELLETLKTMQERFVAQKARNANQKSAKMEARRTVRKAAGVGALRAAAGPPASDTGSVGDASGRSTINSMPSVERRSALEAAIEAGDWEAVGAAAAMMSDGETASADSGDLDQLEDALSSTVEHSQRSIRSGISETDSARAKRIGSLVDVGDWKGVVLATKNFITGGEKQVRGKDEEEALAEAEEWMRIAEKSKPQTTDAGAADAAEWAIQQSLTQLKEVEKKQAKKDASGGDNDGEDEV